MSTPLLPDRHPLSALARARSVGRIAVVGPLLTQMVARLIGYGVGKAQPAVVQAMPEIAAAVLPEQRVIQVATIGPQRVRRPVVHLHDVVPDGVQTWPRVVASVTTADHLRMIRPHAIIVTATDGLSDDVMRYIAAKHGSNDIQCTKPIIDAAWVARGLGCQGYIVRPGSIEPFLLMVAGSMYWLLMAQDDDLKTWRTLTQVTQSPVQAWDIAARAWPHGVLITEHPQAPSMLMAALAAAQITVRDMARQLGHTSNGLVSQVLAGAKPVPLDHALAWGLAAGMDQDQAKRFMEVVALDRTPEPIKSSWRSMRAALDARGITVPV